MDNNIQDSLALQELVDSRGAQGSAGGGTPLSVIKRRNEENGIPQDQQQDDQDQDQHPRSRPNIRMLVSDINKSLDDYAPPDNSEKESETTEEEGFLSFSKFHIPVYIKQFIVIVALYYILSLECVNRTLMNNIPLLQPDEYSRISPVGILLYGVILALASVSVIYLIA